MYILFSMSVWLIFICIFVFIFIISLAVYAPGTRLLKCGSPLLLLLWWWWFWWHWCYACGSCLYRNILFLVWIAAHSSHHRKSFLLSSVLFGKVQVTGIIVKDIYAKFWAQFRFISDRLWAADECQVNNDRRGIVCRLTEIFKAVT